MASQSPVRHLFGLNPSSSELSQYLATLAAHVSTPNPTTPEVKSYPDVVYLNYYLLGLSLLFIPASGYKPKAGLQLSELNNDQLILDSLDIYNIPKSSISGPRSKGSSSRTAELAFSSFPLYPLVFDVGGEVKDKDGNVQTRPSILEVTSQTTGKDFVQCLGEPDRKGGGAGPSSGSIGIWCEWKRDGIMVEFGGDEAKGPQAWERGKDAAWKSDGGTPFSRGTDFTWLRAQQLYYTQSHPSRLSNITLLSTMAAPESLTILDITGTYTMNKVKSDNSTDEILRLQGVSWFKRKAISIGSITLKVKHYKDEEGIEHVDIDQTLTGGIPGTTEKRTLWWKERHNEDHLFGAVVGKTRRTKVDVFDEDFLKKGWTEDTLEYGVIQSYVESDTPKSGTTWIANQTWGIEVVDGERRYTRHVKFTGPHGEDIECRLVYDYLGPL